MQTRNNLWNRLLWNSMGAKNLKKFKKQLDKHADEKSTKVCKIQRYHLWLRNYLENSMEAEKLFWGTITTCLFL